MSINRATIDDAPKDNIAEEVTANPQGRITDINMILGSDDEYFDYGTDEEDNQNQPRKNVSNNSENVAKENLYPRMNVTDINAILGSDDEYIEDEDDETANKDQDHSYDCSDLNAQKPISDIDTILGGHGDYISDDEEVDSNGVKYSSENKEFDIDAIHGSQADYVDDTVYRKKQDKSGRECGGQIDVDYSKNGYENIKEEGQCKYDDSKLVEFGNNTDKYEIDIAMEIDTVNNDVIFGIVMPEEWAVNELSSSDKVEPNTFTNQICFQGRNGNERIIIELSLFLCKEDLVDSQLLVKINSKVINVCKMLNEEMPLFKDNINKDEEIAVKIRCEEIAMQRRDFQYKPLTIDIRSQARSDVPSDNISGIQKDETQFPQFPKLDFPSFGREETPSSLEFNANGNLNNDSQQPSMEVPLFRAPERSSLNANVDNKRYDFRFKLSELKFPSLINKEESSTGSGSTSNVDNKPQRYDFRFKLPKLETTCFGSKENSTEDEVHTRSEDRTERYDFRYTLPKIERPSFFKSENLANSDSAVDHDFNTDIQKEPMDDDSKRYDFRFQLPTIKNPCFGQQENRLDIEDNVSSDHEVGQERSFNVESSSQRYDFRYQLPKLELPSFPSFSRSDKSPNVETDVDITLRRDSDDQNKRYDFRYQLPKVELPKIEFPSFGSKDRSPSIDNDTNIELHESLDGQTQKYDFRYQLPKIELPKIELPKIEFQSFGNKDRSPSLEKDTNIDLHESLDGQTQRYDFRYQLPKIELSSLELQDVDNIDTNVNHQETYLNIENLTNEYEENGIAISEERVHFDEDVNVNGYVDVNLNFDFSEEALKRNETEKERSCCSMEMEQLMMSPNSAQDYARSSSGSSEEHSDIDLYPSPFKFVTLPYFSPRVALQYSRSHSSNCSSSGSSTIGELQEFETDDSKWKLSFDNSSVVTAMTELETSSEIFSPQTEGISLSSTKSKVEPTDSGVPHELKVHKPVSFNGEYSDNDEDNTFSLTFEEYNSPKSNKFRVQMERHVLICTEYFHCKWQPEITRDIKFKSPDKNFRIIILPKTTTDLLVLFNAETIIEYHMKCNIDSMKRLRIEGSTKLNEIKLPD